MTTLVVYPDADPESTTVDGRLRHAGTNLTWAAVQGGAGTNSNDTTPGGSMNSCGEVEAGTTTDRWAQIERGAFLFDTSSIPSGATISSRTLSLYGISKTAGLGSPDLDVVDSAPASNTALAAGDYDSLGTSVYGSVAYASFGTGAYNDISLNGGVTKAGITKLGTRLSWDTENSAPSWSSGAKTSIRAYYADQTGTTSDPKLTVVYSTAVEVTADLLDGAMTVLAPSALQDWNVAPGVVDGAMTVLAPSALQDWNVAPGVVDGAMTVLEPTLPSMVVYAGVLDGAMTVLEPAALQVWRVTADVLDGAMTVLGASLSHAVTADVLDGAMTVLAPAALQDWNVAADVLDGAMTVVDPATAVGGLTVYGWILGSYSLMEDAHKIELLGEYDGMGGRRGADLVVSGQEGRVWREKWHDARVVALRMWIRGDTRAAYQGHIDALMAALGRSEVQTLRRGMADGSERQIDVRLLQGLGFQPESERFARMVVEFTATAPYWRQSDSTIVSVSGVAPGSLPYAFACNNGGSATDDAPVVTLTPSGGTLTNPRLTIGSSWVQYTGTVTTGVTLTIDCGAWTATKGAANVAASISSAASDWLLIPAGDNTATLSGSLSAGTVAASVSFYRRWF